MSDHDFARLPPHDIAAEQAVLGAMMLDPATLADVAAVLSPGDHYRPAHQVVHAAILGLAGRAEPFDVISVAAELERTRSMQSLGDAGRLYLHDLIAAVPAAANAGYYALIVRNRARLRRMAEVGTRIMQAASNPDADTDELLAFAETELAGLAKEALGAVSARLRELRAAVLDSDGLDQLPAPEPLIDGLLYRDCLAWLHGKPGHAKSLLALDWACCVSNGLAWQGRPVTQGPVLYVIAEGATGLHARVRAWEDRAGQRTAVTFLPVAVQMLAAADAQALAALAADLGCVLVVIDTQARVTVGADENSAVDMGRLVEAAEQIRAASRACVKFVHHEPRAGDNLRGSTALEGAAESILRVVKDGPRVELTNPKQKNAALADPVTLWVVPHLNSVVIAGQPEGPILDLRAESENKILATLLDSFGTTGASATKLVETTGLSKSTFYWALNRLVTDGRVQNLGTKRSTLYVIAQPAMNGEVQQVQRGPSPTGPMSNALTEGKRIGLPDSLDCAP